MSSSVDPVGTTEFVPGSAEEGLCSPLAVCPVVVVGGPDLGFVDDLPSGFPLVRVLVPAHLVGRVSPLGIGL